MRRKRLVIGLLIALPLAVFWQTRNFDFVWDDEVNVAKNPYLTALTLSNVKPPLRLPNGTDCPFTAINESDPAV